MATYFTSDQHMTLRYPDRGERFARFIGLLNPGEDHLVIAGDLVDFWYAAREAGGLQCVLEPGLKALKEFVGKNGRVTLIAGNHDQHLGWYYEREFGLKFDPEPFERELDGCRIRVVHGHLLGGRSRWKGWMESRFFLRMFQQVPDFIANKLADQLKTYNSRNRKGDNLRHYMVFERYVKSLGDSDADFAILGHVHQTIFTEVEMESIPKFENQAAARKSMVVLGHWFYQSSWLKIENGKASFYIWEDQAERPEQVMDQRTWKPV
ncbi:MAG: metallophosphoesterase [Planctomycetota bacterium]